MAYDKNSSKKVPLPVPREYQSESLYGIPILPDFYFGTEVASSGIDHLSGQKASIGWQLPAGLRTRIECLTRLG